MLLPKKVFLVCCVLAVLPVIYWIGDDFLRKEPKLSFLKNIKSLIRNRKFSVDNSEKYPFMAFLYISYNHSTEICGGTLINPKYILTAAHCLEGATLVDILLGTNNLLNEEKPKITLKSSTFIIHKFFNNQTYDNDIALIVLKDDILYFKEHENFVSLITDYVDIETFNLPSIVLGWGQNDTNTGANDKLLEKKVEIVDSIHCFLKHDVSKLCAFGKNGPCHGDSGGPLLLGNIQIGIVSKGSENCDPSKPTVYTDILYYQDWIKNKVRQ